MRILKDCNFLVFAMVFFFVFLNFFVESTEEHERFLKDLFDFKAKPKSDLAVAKDSPLGERQPLVRPCY